MLGRRVEVERVCAVIALLLVFIQVQLPVGHLPLGLVVSGLLVPIWAGRLRQFEGARVLVLMGGAAIASGVLLSVAGAPHRVINVSAGLDDVNHLATLVGMLGVVLWSRTLLRDADIAIIVGVALILSVSHSGNYELNPFKFGYGVPLIILVLGLCWRIGSARLELIGVVALAAVSAANDARSSFGMLVLVGVLVVWQMAATSKGPSRSWLPGVALVCAASWLVFQAAQGLILGGFLGAETQERTQAQVDQSGSVLVSGRPELAATRALMREHPGGFGVGAVPTVNEVNTAKTGMAAASYDPNNGYVDNYMFGTHFELHSMFGDLWASFGLVGLALTATMVLVGVRGFALSLTGRVASALLMFLAARMLWDVAFSPFFGSVETIVLFLGFAMIKRPTDDGELVGGTGAPSYRRLRGHVQPSSRNIAEP